MCEETVKPGLLRQERTISNLQGLECFRCHPPFLSQRGKADHQKAQRNTSPEKKRHLPGPEGSQSGLSPTGPLLTPSSLPWTQPLEAGERRNCWRRKNHTLTHLHLCICRCLSRPLFTYVYACIHACPRMHTHALVCFVCVYVYLVLGYSLGLECSPDA